jgi:hypothetical protein
MVESKEDPVALEVIEQVRRKSHPGIFFNVEVPGQWFIKGRSLSWELPTGGVQIVSREL